MDIKITDVQIRKMEGRKPLLGYANVVFNDCFVVKGIAILENDKGRWIGMPARRTTRGKYQFRDMCHPINQKTRDLITQEVFEEFDKSETKEEK